MVSIPRTQVVEKIEVATGGSRGLDCLISRHFGSIGCENYRDDFNSKFDMGSLAGFEGAAYSWGVPEYTTSFEDARSLSDWVLLQLSDIGADGLPFAKLGDPSKSPPVEVSGIGATIILSLVIAGLKTKVV